jgi:hypothetical protein
MSKTLMADGSVEYRTRTLVKEQWGKGPWNDEPDKVQFVDEATDMDCLIVRGPSGALCGYVGVEPGHPLHGVDYDGVDVDVHGGLTFAGPCSPEENEETSICHVAREGRPDHVWWFGFDCAHFGDLAPRHAMRDREAGFEFEETYRELPYVKAEVVNLAKQLKERAIR